jgi:hypothetical protein
VKKIEEETGRRRRLRTRRKGKQMKENTVSCLHPS